MHKDYSQILHLILSTLEIRTSSGPGPETKITRHVTDIGTIHKRQSIIIQSPSNNYMDEINRLIYTDVKIELYVIEDTIHLIQFNPMFLELHLFETLPRIGPIQIHHVGRACALHGDELVQL